MEPLSVAASIISLLGATAKIAEVLTAFVRSTKNAPTLAKKVLSEVSDINGSVAQLQDFLQGARTELRSRKAMIMMDQVVVSLTTCVLTVSELEAIVGTRNMTDPEKLLTRVSWAKREKRIAKLVNRLQWSKTSLTLMLTTLTWSAALA